MIVYVEPAFAENFFIDFSLLFLAVKTVRGNVRLGRLVASAAFGATFALLYPLLRLPSVCSVLLKGSVGAAMSLLSVKKEKFRKRIVVAGFFYGYAFCLGGLLFAVQNVGGWSQDGRGEFLLAASPATFVLSATAFFTVLLLSLLPKIFRRIKILKKSVRCTLVFRERVIEETALLDSGNQLTADGMPVSVVTLSLAARLLGELSQETAVRTVEVSTVNGIGKICVFRIDELRIYSEGQVHTIKGAYLGIGRQLSDECAVILNSAYLPGGDL